ncbi:hypothetical protein WJX72_009399 [[Myrmecia] bisecta]|uniref:dihydropyrimidinase n=1 Tax=[Myrmecia] bisecta TaxID=41462 RepID=A0AAW1P7E3_9CHLO
MLRKACLRLAVLAAVTVLAAGEPSWLLIKGGTVVNADREFLADVLIKDGLIKIVGPHLEAPKGAKVLDASGKLVMPGGIDPHTHLDWQWDAKHTIDTFVSGQSGALAGGTTTHIDFIMPTDDTGDLERAFEEYKALAADSVMDYAFHAIVRKWNPKVVEDMGKLAAQGVASFKFFMDYKGFNMLPDEAIIRGFARCRELGALPLIHAENGEAVAWMEEQLTAAGITGPEASQIAQVSFLEGEATTRALAYARLVNVPLYVVHIMSRDAIQAIAHARTEGQRVFGETIDGAFGTHNDSSVWDPDYDTAAKLVTSSAVHDQEHQRYIKRALATGTLDLIATDHTPWNRAQKRWGVHDFREIAIGLNTIEFRMHIAWDELVNSGLISHRDYVRLTSTKAAQIFNMYPQKGAIAADSDADLIIFDPDEVHTLSAKAHHTASDICIYEGRTVKGKVTTTISRGEVVWQDSKLSIKPGRGRFIKRATHGPIFDGYSKQDWIALHFPQGKTPVTRKLPKRPADAPSLKTEL